VREATDIQARTNSLSDSTPATAPRVWQGTYLLLTIMLCMMFSAVLFPGVEVRLSLTLIFFAVMILTLKRWTAGILFALIQLHLYYFDPRSLTGLSPNAGLTCEIPAILLVVVISRYRVLQELDPNSGLAFLNRIRTMLGESQIQHRRLLFSNLRSLAIQLLKTFLFLTCCGGFALFLMMWVPPPQFEGVESRREFGLHPSGYRAIKLGLTIFFLFLIAWVVVNEIVWRSSSRQQSSIYVRGTFLNWLHRDLRMVVVQRLKRKRKKARKLEPVSRDGADADKPMIFDEKE